ncbi:MAG: hypothetical protein ACYDB4_19415 [Candidatus Dormibacteraceae bacterium]
MTNRNSSKQEVMSTNRAAVAILARGLGGATVNVGREAFLVNSVTQRKEAIDLD